MDTHEPAPHSEGGPGSLPGGPGSLNLGARSPNRDPKSEDLGHPTEHSPLAVGVFCPDCGYDLRSLTSERCPECGFGLELVRSPESQIPWSRRRELGRFRAYWKTVLLVMRRPKRFCVEMVRPVSYADSQSFRWVTLLHAWLPILIGSVIWYFYDGPSEAADHDLEPIPELVAQASSL